MIKLYTINEFIYCRTKSVRFILLYIYIILDRPSKDDLLSDMHINRTGIGKGI